MDVSSKPAALADFQIVIPWPVQWGDQDAFGHVNNTVYFRWFESARIAYFAQSGLGAALEPLQLGPILAKISCNYRRQLTFPDTVWIGTRVKSIGNSSLVIEHAIYSEQLQTIAADGDSVVVVFNYEANSPCPVPQVAREAISRTEGKTFG